MRPTRPLALLALPLLLATPLALAGDEPTLESAGYVLGSGNDALGGFCTGTAPGVGGACGVPLHSTTALVRVTDERMGLVAFRFIGIAADGSACGASGTAASPVTLALPEGCAELRVFPQLGATRGHVHVWS